MYCSESALNEPMAGTADAVDVWLLLEYRPAWRAKATEDNALAEPVRRWLAQQQAALAAKGRKSRLQLIRQPELDRGDITLFVGDAAGSRRYRAPTYDALTMLSLAEGGEALCEPHYFVCTNAARDRCCGRLGLPLHAALRERIGERVWQTTHVGGHRFAPNVLALPQGCLYGRVQAEAVDDFLAAVEQGALGARWLRGRSFTPHVVQAAEIFAAGPDDAPSARASVESFTDERWRVRFANGRVADVQLGPPIESLASCGDVVPKAVRGYVEAQA